MTLSLQTTLCQRVACEVNSRLPSNYYWLILTRLLTACTAVVTEISYHSKKTIEGDVSFLSEAEWRDELSVLLDDLVDEDGNLKRSTDLRSDAGVAWQKVYCSQQKMAICGLTQTQVHAVYPSISPEQLIKLSMDQIIARDLSMSLFLISDGARTDVYLPSCCQNVRHDSAHFRE